DADRLEHGAHRAAGNDARTGARRLEHHLRGAVAADHLVWQRARHDRHGDHRAACLLESLADRLRNLVRLAERDADVAITIADRDQCREREAASALHDLRHAIDEDHVLDHVGIAFARPTALAVTAPALAPLLAAASRISRAALIIHAQNSRPPSRAPSANAATRPWYWYPPRSNTTRVMPAAFAFSASSLPAARASADFVPSSLLRSDS